MFNSEEILRRAGCTEEEIKSIKAQHRGGKAGRNGIKYEDYYAVYRLVKGLKNSFDNGQETTTILQNLMPVDDVVVKSETTEFCQLKNSASVTWSSNDNELSQSFFLQKRICENLSINFKLKLVVSDKKRQELLTQKLPEIIQSCTEAEHFPFFEQRTQALQQNEFLRKELEAVCAVDPESPSHIETIFAYIYDLLARAPSEKGCSTKDLIDNISNASFIVPIRLPNVDLPQNWQTASEILNKIEGFEINIVGGVCFYVYNRGYMDKGLIGRVGSISLNRFFQRVIKDEPDSFEKFEELLP